MAKRGATEQITKELWERDEDDGGRDRSEEPAEVASQAVLAKRKILKPKSRVGGASAAPPSPSPASTGLFNFGQPAPSLNPGTSLFGQQAQTTTTPSKNLFGQPVPLSSTPAGNPFGASTQSQKPLFGNLFGTPAPASDATPTALETAAAKPTLGGSAPQPTPNLFGTPAAAPQPATTTPKPSTFLFGAPSAQAAKPGPSIFAASTPAESSNGTITEPQKNLFGFSVSKPQDSAEAAPSSNPTTPLATPAKPSLFNLFGDTSAQPKPLFGAQSQPQAPNFKPKEKDVNENPPSFGAGNSLFAPNSAQTNSNSLFSISKPTETQPAPASNLFKAAAAGSSEVKKTSEDVKKEMHDPKSLTPPPGVGVAKQDMPAFNWLFQVRSLNVEFQERVREALAKDPFADLSNWIDFYHTRLAHFESVKLSQQNQLQGNMDVEADSHTQNIVDQTTVTPSKASKLFESALAPVANKPLNSSNQNDKNPAGDSRPFSSSVFQPKPPTGLFNQPPQTAGVSNPPAESIFSNSSAKPSGLFGATSASNNEAKTSSPFQFGSQNKAAPANLFDSNSSKEPDNATPKLFAPSAFPWNSKPNSAVASNASSPGSVLAGGTAGMKDADAGGWSNPFTQENPLFLPGGDDDDDDDGEDGDDGEGEVEGENEGDEDNEIAEDAPESLTATKPEPTSIFGAQTSSSNSLFGRVTSTPTFSFGQTTAPKTGAVGLFGSTTGAGDKQTWTPDKGIRFGDRADSKSGTTSGPVPTTSLFGLQNQAPAPAGLFGNNNSIPTFNFAQPANGKSIFSNPPSKPPTPSVLFGGPTSGGLAPPTTMFGGPSPAPSDISTPGESSSNKEGGEDDNDPSDEAGQQGGNTKDLSGKGPGEEDEDEVFETRSSIYNLNNGQYVKIGIGRLRVLKNRTNARSRIVVKVETGKILMNVGLRKELDYTKVSESEAGGKVVKIIEFLPEGKSRVWVMKVGTVELAQKLRKTLEEHK
ncbi:hypothetical protein TWF281_001952 [Arthrobotrys megalospora]